MDRLLNRGIDGWIDRLSNRWIYGLIDIWRVRYAIMLLVSAYG